MLEQLRDLAPDVDVDRALAVTRSQITRRRIGRAVTGVGGAVVVVGGGIVLAVSGGSDDTGTDTVATDATTSVTSTTRPRPGPATDLPDRLTLGILDWTVVPTAHATVEEPLELAPEEFARIAVTLTNDSSEPLQLGVGLPWMQTLFDDGAGNVLGGSAVGPTRAPGQIWNDVASGESVDAPATVSAVAPIPEVFASNPPLAPGIYRMWLVLPDGRRVVPIDGTVTVAEVAPTTTASAASAELPQSIGIGKESHAVVRDATASVAEPLTLRLNMSTDVAITLTNHGDRLLRLGRGGPTLFAVLENGSGTIVARAGAAHVAPGRDWPDLAPGESVEVLAVAGAVRAYGTPPPYDGEPLAPGQYRMWLLLPDSRAVLVDELVTVTAFVDPG